jgi:hypothetical protein
MARIKAEEFVRGGAESEDEPIDETGGEKLIEDEEGQAAEAAGAIAAGVSDLALVDEMLEIARKHGPRPDARIKRLAEWVRVNMAPEQPTASSLHRIRGHAAGASALRGAQEARRASKGRDPIALGRKTVGGSA